MSGFYYFLEDVACSDVLKHGELDRGVLARFGISDTLADVRESPEHCIVTPTVRGPSDKPGVLLFPIAAESVPANPTYDPDTQAWNVSQVGNRKGLAAWIGYERASPPRPEELMRTRNFPGYMVNDGHGRAWSVPILRGIDRPYGTLPCDWQWPDDDFTPVPMLREQYRKLWEDSARVWDWCYVDDDPDPVDETFVAGFVSRVLAINHRVGPRELNVLRSIGLAPFDRSTVVNYASAACDLHGVQQFVASQKKTPPRPEPGGEPSSPGTLAVTPTGDPVEAS